MGIWPDQPYFPEGEGEMNVAVLMHIQYTHTVGKLIIFVIEIPLTKSLGYKPKLGKTMNIINTKDVPTRLASPYSVKYKHRCPLSLPKDESSNWSPSY